MCLSMPRADRQMTPIALCSSPPSLCTNHQHQKKNDDTPWLLAAGTLKSRSTRIRFRVCLSHEPPPPPPPPPPPSPSRQQQQQSLQLQMPTVANQTSRKYDTAERSSISAEARPVRTACIICSCASIRAVHIATVAFCGIDGTCTVQGRRGRRNRCTRHRTVALRGAHRVF